MRKLQGPPTARLHLVHVATNNGRYWTADTYRIHASAQHVALARAFLAHKRTLARGTRITAATIHIGARWMPAKERKP